MKKIIFIAIVSSFFFILIGGNHLFVQNEQDVTFAYKHDFSLNEETLSKPNSPISGFILNWGNAFSFSKTVHEQRNYVLVGFLYFAFVLFFLIGKGYLHSQLSYFESKKISYILYPFHVFW